MSPARKRRKPAAKAAGEVPAPASSTPAAPGPEAFFTYTDPDHGQIGRGSTGSLHGIPECPVCFAEGGGGHGSGCPNAGKDPQDWVAEPPDGWVRPQAGTAYG